MGMLYILVAAISIIFGSKIGKLEDKIGKLEDEKRSRLADVAKHREAAREATQELLRLKEKFAQLRKFYPDLSDRGDFRVPSTLTKPFTGLVSTEYRCRCGRTSGSIETMVEHVQVCRLNPATKACETCEAEHSPGNTTFCLWKHKCPTKNCAHHKTRSSLERLAPVEGSGDDNRSNQ